MADKIIENTLSPIHAFRFQIDFKEQLLSDQKEGKEVVLCSGAFSECTGLEATMEPKVIKEGGRNWGSAQRMGQVSFSTVVLKRGLTKTKDLWKWFDLVGHGAYSHRLNVVITLFDQAGDGLLSWKLNQALPIKFKTADLNAKASDVAVEELHLAHEGFVREKAMVKSLFDT